LDPNANMFRLADVQIYAQRKTNVVRWKKFYDGWWCRCFCDAAYWRPPAVAVVVAVIVAVAVVAGMPSIASKWQSARNGAMSDCYVELSVFAELARARLAAKTLDIRAVSANIRVERPTTMAVTASTDVVVVCVLAMTRTKRTAVVGTPLDCDAVAVAVAAGLEPLCCRRRLRRNDYSLCSYCRDLSFFEN